MTRPTALICQVLLLQLLEGTVHKALVEPKRDLKDADVHIIQLKDAAMDLVVGYRCDNLTIRGHLYEADARS